MAVRFLSPVQKTARQIAGYLEQQTAGLEVTTTDGHLLSYLASYTPAPMTELHRVLGVKRSTMTSLLDRLEARSWVRRVPSPRDRRALLVELTHEGRVHATRIRDVLEQLEADIAARVAATDIKGFLVVLTAITSTTSSTSPATTASPDTPTSS